MIRPIVKSPALLSTPSVDATPADAAVGQDLLDTLAAHAHECVGLAANMIGVRKRVIVAACAGGAVLMYNPESWKRRASIKPRKAVCRSKARVRARATGALKSLISTRRSRRAKSRSRVSTHKSSSTKSTTARAL